MKIKTIAHGGPVKSKKLLRSAMSIAIHYTRKRLGLGQVQVSKLTGMSQSHISKVESDNLTLDAPSWLVFCDVTNLDPNVVFLSEAEMLKAIDGSAKLKAIQVPVKGTEKIAA